MDQKRSVVTFQQVLARNVRRIRQEKNLLQEDIAAASRRAGLKWSSVTVTQIESRNRAIYVEEFVLLPVILGCTLKDLVQLDTDQLIQLSFDAVVPASFLEELVSEEGPDPDTAHQAFLPALETELSDDIKLAISRGRLEATLLTYLLIREGARGEAERKAAQTLRVPALEITAYALRCWGRSLTEERDERAAEQATEEKQVRAVRGHITRTLMQCIEKEHESNRRRRDEPPLKLKPHSGDERDLRRILLADFEKDEAVRKKAEEPYKRWMRFKILEALEKEGTTR